MSTERLRLCPLVFNNDLRHPAVLAQELATLDVLSEGRVVVGIGAGWNEPEYRSIDLAFDPPAVRISRMLEAIAILRALFGDGPTNFDGRFYSISELDGQPKPIQRPHPPFLSAGPASECSGSPPARRRSSGWTCARTGSRSAMPSPSAWTSGSAGSGTRPGTGSSDWSSACSAARPDQRHDEPLKVAADVARSYEAGTGLAIDPRDVLESPYSLIGSVPDLVAKLREGRERWGINSILVGWFDEPELRDFAPVVEQLAGT
jgi:alkanesulfonate monooxygenase SsuD/methylene tetrahydromethanopterin reductase-like flavin-dependent oxidoreductase (luciferase family)